MIRVSPVDAILARFPGPVTLHASRVKWLSVLAGSIGFVALLYMMRDHVLGPIGMFKFWVGIVFFGVGALVSAAMLLPGAGSLTLGADGFHTRTLFRTFRTPWRTVGDFVVVRTPRRFRYVGFDDGTGNSLSRRMTGVNAALPDTYGLSHEDLARLMNLWRARAMTQSRERLPGSPGAGRNSLHQASMPALTM